MIVKKFLALVAIIFCGMFFAKNAYAGSLTELSCSRSSDTAGATGVTYSFSYKMENPGEWTPFHFNTHNAPWTTSPSATIQITKNFNPTEWYVAGTHFGYYVYGGSAWTYRISPAGDTEPSFTTADTFRAWIYNAVNSTPGPYTVTVRTAGSSGATIDSATCNFNNNGAQIISTNSASSVSHTTATLNGNLSNIGYPGSITEYGFVWNTSPNPTTSNNKVNLGATGSATSYSHGLTGLSYQTTYYVKSYSISSQYGTVYGDQISFTTTIPTYTVSYNANSASSGSVPSNQTKTHGINVTLADNSNGLARTGYTFLGWNTASNGLGTDYATGQTYSTNEALSLYAKWQRHVYEIEFDANTATGTMANQSFSYDVAQNISNNNFSKVGYTFSGWNTASNGSGISYSNSQNISNITAIDNDTVTFYAQWTPNTYEIAFNEPRATSGAMTNQTFTYDESQNLKANTLVRPGFLFREWNTAQNRSGTSYTNGTSILNLTPTDGDVINLYAHWWEIKSSTSSFQSQPVTTTPPVTTPPTTTPPTTTPPTTSPATTRPSEVETKKIENQKTEDKKETLISETKNEQETNQKNILITETFKTQIAKLEKPIMYGADNDINDIKVLEQFLKHCEGIDIAIDGIYSQSDRDIVIKWQEKYHNDILSPWGITEGTGHIYIKSLEKIKELSNKCTISSQENILKDKYVFKRDLFVTSTGEEVRQLQSYLNNNGFPLIDSGEGSKGQETNYFGELTKRALSKFQQFKNINPFDGYFGPFTRKVINGN